MKLKIAHTTTYTYDAPVSYALQQVRLSPVSNKQQTVSYWRVSVEGGSQELSYKDHHGNETLLVSTDPGEQSLRVLAEGEVETLDSTGILGKTGRSVPLWHFLQPTHHTTAGPKIRALTKQTLGGNEVLAGLHALSAEILAALPYLTGKTISETPAEEALAGDGGVCQDHAQIFITAARLSGIPARYVSGYLMMDNRVEQDATHAWAEVHLDTLGWVGFDVSNGISPDERYIRLATGRDYREAAPISGIRMGSGAESMIVSLQVQQ